MNLAARLALAGIIGAALLFALEAGARASSPGGDWTQTQRLAMQRTIAAQEALAEARAAAVDSETARELPLTDPRNTGLVGVEWSYLVTTAGQLDAKQASTDPRWAALFVEWFRRAGAGPDRPVALGSSASFPALMLAARIAAETIGADVRIAASLTASNHGATIPEFDLASMEDVLQRGGFVHDPIAVLTPGGDSDRALGFDDEAAALLDARLDEITAQGRIEVQRPESIQASIELRDAVLLTPDPSPAIFVNVGGHSANYGVGAAALALPHGYIDPADFTANESGDSVALRSLRAGIPVVNALNIRAIMLDSGIDPDDEDVLALPAAGYGWPWRAASGGLALILIVVLARTTRRFKDEQTQLPEPTPW